ncbi:MAG: hypothetical protein ABL872_08830, partial [Lacibacter sp.]
SSAFAQKGRMYAQNTTVMQLDKYTIPADNFLFADALDANNQMRHTASFDILLSDDAALRDVLTLFQVYSKERTGSKMIFITLNYAGENLQERVYENPVVEEILFPALDASSATLPFKATIKIRADKVELQKGGIKPQFVKRNKYAAFCSNFSLSVGKLPANRVSKISGMSIKPGNQQTINLTIELSALDGAAWNQWFLTGAGGAIQQGNISLLAPNLKDVLYNISLADVEIVSYSNSAGNRVLIGLRTKGIRIK